MQNMIKIKGLAHILAMLSLLMLALPGQAKTVEVKGVRLWDAPDSTRVVLDIDAAANYKIFALKQPDRLVVDLSDAELGTQIPAVANTHPLLSRIRGGRRHGSDLRVVFDLKTAVAYESFVLQPNDEYGHRLVIDLSNPDAKKTTAERPVTGRARSEPRDVIIAIDAGHGGEDPGARGRRGTREKDVVLAIARRLERLVRQQKGMRPVLIRDGDYYLSLRQRIEKAREQKADLFVSIHADAFHNPRVKGSSVYVLSSKGASDEASRWLAERENAADLMGGVSLTDKDDVLASVLLDLSLTGTIEASTHVAKRVLDSIQQVAPVHKPNVQYAGFVVLKSPDIPSLLVETAFISNPREERKLKDPRYQQKLAGAIMRGVKGYFSANPPPGTWLAVSDRTHTIRRGETLSSIALRYQVGVGQLRVANQLSDDLVRVGQVLQIP